MQLERMSKTIIENVENCSESRNLAKREYLLTFLITVVKKNY